jgi:peptidoglycan/LPS O-acetylase OafA/YrhL
MIWLFGVVVWWAAKQPRAMAIVRTPGWRVLTALGFLATLAASKTPFILGSDFAVGLAFALWLPSLLGAWRKPGWWSRLGGGLSAISYTLYVVHFPLLFFVAATQLKGRQFAPDGTGISWFLALSVASLIVAIAMWWVFERQTDRVRRWLAQVLRISPARRKQVVASET